jgi:hypothetical protein
MEERMAFCKRTNNPDPLVNRFLRDYGVNLLPIPRANARPGDLYVKTGKKVKAVPGALEELVTPRVELPEPFEGEELADLSGVLSSGVDLKFGLGLLDGFLSALGLAAGIPASVSTSLERKGTHALRFEFDQVTRDSIDPFKLGTRLIGAKWNAAHPWVSEGNSYYVAGAVVRSPSLSMRADDGTGTAVDLDVEVFSAISGKAGISVQKQSSGAITYSDGKSIAIGVELYNLRYDEERGGFQMGDQQTAVDLKRGKRVQLEPEFPAEDDDALLEVEEFDEDKDEDKS